MCISVSRPEQLKECLHVFFMGDDDIDVYVREAPAGPEKTLVIIFLCQHIIVNNFFFTDTGKQKQNRGNYPGSVLACSTVEQHALRSMGDAPINLPAAGRLCNGQIASRDSFGGFRNSTSLLDGNIVIEKWAYLGKGLGFFSVSCFPRRSRMVVTRRSSKQAMSASLGHRGSSLRRILPQRVYFPEAVR